MAGPDPSRPTAGRVAIATALTAVAGFVDALGWIALDRVFTAQMSGNTVLVAVQSAAGDGAAALLHVYTIGMFLAGLLLSGTAIEIGIRCGLRRLLAVAMAIEAACLAVFAAWGDASADPSGGGTPQGWALYLLVAVTALAMGTQNTSLRVAGVLGVYTTHVTGTLTRLSEDLVAWGFTLADRRAARRGGLTSGRLHARAPASLAKIGLSAALFLGFLGGAFLAAWLTPVLGRRIALMLPIAVVAIVGCIDAIRPLTDTSGKREQGP